MTIGLMQPYVFPYIGYFQLVNAVDKFIFYDDVNFIKQGWINRNRILLNNKDFLFSVPLTNITSFSTIRETKLDRGKYFSWCKKFMATLTQGYKKAKYFEQCYSLVDGVLFFEYDNISELAASSISAVNEYIKLDRNLELTSSFYNNSDLKGQTRVIDICKKENATRYINVGGGKSLYSKTDFEANNIELAFITPREICYDQLGGDFVPWLSIIDVLMFNSPEKVKTYLEDYELT